MSEGNRGSESNEVTLLSYAAVVRRHAWLIVGFFVVAVVVSYVITITTSKVYESTATLLAPREGGSSAGLLGGLAASGLLQQVPGLAVASFTPNRDLMVSLLKSRTVALAVVERFGLQERYRARYLGDAIKALQGTTIILISRDGVISIRVEDINPQLASDMANFYVEQLDRLVARYGTGEAGRQRVFLTGQLARAKADLDAVEESLRRFQVRHRAISLQEQTKGAIEAAARLKGELMAAEVQLQVMRNFATDANPEMIAIARRVDEMKRQLGRMQYGDGEPGPQASSPDRRDFVVPFPKVPEVGIELVRLTRDVKVQETLVTLLTQQIEQARMAEARDMPVVQVLDKAVPAERHSKPRLRNNLAIAGVTSLFTGIVAAFFIEYLRNTRRRVRTSR